VSASAAQLLCIMLDKLACRGHVELMAEVLLQQAERALQVGQAAVCMCVCARTRCSRDDLTICPGCVWEMTRQQWLIRLISALITLTAAARASFAVEILIIGFSLRLLGNLLQSSYVLLHSRLLHGAVPSPLSPC